MDMKKIILPLAAYDQKPSFPLVDVAQKTIYVNGEPTKDKYTLYTVSIKYNRVGIRVDTTGSIVPAEEVSARAEAENPFQIAFENAVLTITTQSGGMSRARPDLVISGTADKATLYPVKDPGK